MAALIDGKAIARSIEAEAEEGARALRSRGLAPHLVTIQVGQSPATDVYIRNQEKRFRRIGIAFTHLALDAAADETAVRKHVRSLNENPTVTGIMVTLPLPAAISTIRVQEEILPLKDVEGVGPFNLGNLILNRGAVGPCSALAVLEAIRATGAPTEGARAVVVGHSNIVGMPVTLCLLRDLATTTTCHIATRDLAEETRRADILVVAVGKPGLITQDMVKPGAVVVDVGISRVKDPAGEGTRLVGDVAFEEVSRRASWITPVPGGIGPITVALLARNVVICARQLLLGGREPERSPRPLPGPGGGGRE
jgi:methylenetetrahydrofolate dehydrogenase (NADP+)/methenyltetrahydrofolate cyclohydrolase